MECCVLFCVIFAIHPSYPSMNAAKWGATLVCIACNILCFPALPFWLGRMLRYQLSRVGCISPRTSPCRRLGCKPIGSAPWLTCCTPSWSRTLLRSVYIVPRLPLSHRRCRRPLRMLPPFLVYPLAAFSVSLAVRREDCCWGIWPSMSRSHVNPFFSISEMPAGSMISAAFLEPLSSRLRGRPGPLP